MTSLPARDRRLRVLRLVLFSLSGAMLGLLLAGRVKAGIGPFETTLTVRPAVAGVTTVHLAPLGTIELDTHDAPLALELRVDELQVDEAQRIARDPAVLGTLEDDIAGDARRALWSLAFRALIVAVAGGALGAFIASPGRKPVLAGAGVGAVLAVVGGGLAALTFEPGAVAKPRYGGLLAVAPTAVGDVQSLVTRFGEYRAQLTELVANVAKLYQATQGLPVAPPTDDAIRVLHVSDIHLNPGAFDLIGELVEQFSIDAVADTGDITDWGTEPEAQLLEGLGRLDVPYVWVRGNHDSTGTQTAVASQPQAVVLDGTSATVAGLRFWGIGDPRYTPDKNQPIGPDVERDVIEAFAPSVRRRITAEAEPVDLVLVHDARAAAELGGRVPLILAGHTHTPRERRMGPSTLLLVEGSTGGAGLRGLQGEVPKPLTSSILYFHPVTHRLVAYDRVTVSALGGSGVQIERHVPAPVAELEGTSTTTGPGG